ncbi:Hypothetical protein NGAL_HAMBI2610_42080 [Neorhizobium galegae bv. orientalis]|nr:Hypothetical protein NGAL_HAMBI2610_42080 [Neorhizobium galegae bv. orientalis]
MAKYTQKKIATKLAAKAAAGDDEISPEQQGELKVLGEGIRSLGRRSTEEAMELGGYLSRAKAILPERQLGAWVKAICKFTPKTARNYIAVYENLSAYQDRLVEAAVAPTTLFVLAYAKERDVEQVLSAFEAGEQLTVTQVKAMVGATVTKKVALSDDLMNVPGLAGLRKVAQLKVEQDAARFVGLTTAVLTRVEKALEPLAEKKAVVKKTLQDKVMLDCRHAHDLLNSVCAPLQPDVTAYMNWRAVKLPEGTAWRKVQDLLRLMGGATWPERAEFVPWLQDEVVPLLRFVVHGEALAGEGVAHQSEIDDAATDDTEGLIPFAQMPAPIKQMVEEALETASPENREELESLVYFDPAPSKRQAA